MSELLPCPFCGSHAQTDFIEGVSYIIECYGCEARTDYHGDAESAIAAWNRRASPVPQEAQPVYFFRINNGTWMETSKESIDRMKETLGEENFDVRILYAHPPSGKDAEDANKARCYDYLLRKVCGINGKGFDFVNLPLMPANWSQGSIAQHFDEAIRAAMSAEGRKG